LGKLQVHIPTTNTQYFKSVEETQISKRGLFRDKPCKVINYYLNYEELERLNKKLELEGLIFYHDYYHWKYVSRGDSEATVNTSVTLYYRF